MYPPASSDLFTCFFNYRPEKARTFGPGPDDNPGVVPRPVIFMSFSDCRTSTNSLLLLGWWGEMSNSQKGLQRMLSNEQFWGMVLF